MSTQKVKTALIIVDMQNDFMDDGTLPVKGALALAPVIVRTLDHLRGRVVVITTQDWHKPGSQHFQKWPVHCVQETPGADIVKQVWDALPEDAIHIYKGDGEQDGYDAFEGHEHGREALLDDILESLGIENVYVCGVATDYCVVACALSAASRGYRTHLLTHAVAGVAEGTTAAAMDNMATNGITFMKFD